MNSLIIKIIRPVVRFFKYRNYPHITSTSRVEKGCHIYNTFNLYMAEDTNIDSGAIIMNTNAKFVMKKWSGAAIGLTVITGNHVSIVGKAHKMVTEFDKQKIDVNHECDKDVIVDEDVWIASNVTLLSGVHLGKCSIIGAGSVVRNNIPPYAIVAGNPAKIVGFRFTPEEALIHERALFQEHERMTIEELTDNYNKFFIKRLKEIKSFLKN